MAKNEKTISVSLYLHDKDTERLEDCIKDDVAEFIKIYDVDPTIGMEGKIIVHETVAKLPKWYDEINALSKSQIEIEDNASNKAVVILKHRNRYFSISYGYGKSLLDESTIVRNFGLITSVNLMDAEKIRSLNSMTIENVIVDTQKQSSSSSSQDNLQIDQNKEILKSVSGSPKDENVAKFLVGTDSLHFTRQMDIKNIKDQIEHLYQAFKNDDYKKNGFGWLDNIKRIKDTKTIEDLNDELSKDILKNYSEISVSPNKILEWENISGFYLSGMGKKPEPSFEIDSNEYFKFINEKEKKHPSYIIKKLKRDQLYAVYKESDDESIANIYQSLIYECEVEGRKYILTFGEWFEVNKNYYDEVSSFVDDIPRCAVELSAHDIDNNEKEGDYNKRVTKLDNDLELLDMKNFRLPQYGQSKIEPCDVISRDKHLIHVKKRGYSSDLSHLFSQAYVSARILANEVKLKDHINEQVQSKFGSDFIEDESTNSDFEVVFAIITEKKHKTLSKYLPFFSMVNLRQTIDNLKSMSFKYSMMIIESK